MTFVHRSYIFVPRLLPLSRERENNAQLLLVYRALSTTAALARDGSESWLSKLLVRKIEPTKESHSRMLSDKEIIYELHTHNIRPDSVGQYMEN